MARVQLALNVSDLDEAVAFYAAFFKVGPAKVRPGYANFAIDEPPLKLVLIEGTGVPGSINHLGVEVAATDEVTEAAAYLAGAGMATDVDRGPTCCYAVQDKVWVDRPRPVSAGRSTRCSPTPGEAPTTAGGAACCRRSRRTPPRPHLLLRAGR